MITSLTLDKRLRDKNLRTGDLSQETLASHLNELQDMSGNVRYRKTDAELLAEAEAKAKAEAEALSQAEAAAEGENNEQQEG